eukprot:6211796-Pleurochrysis_carterae.AAC.1
MEFKQLKLELLDQYASFAFDGTTRLCEALCLTARWCPSSFSQIETRLLRFITSKEHLKGNQLASIIATIILLEAGVAPQRCVSIARDGASVNGAACRILTASPFAASLLVLCISHTSNNAGLHNKMDAFNDWMTPWLKLVGGRGALYKASNLSLEAARCAAAGALLLELAL